MDRGLIQDIRYANRMLRRNLGISAIIVVTLALVIGMNAAVFSVFKAVLLDPLQYPHYNRLVSVLIEGAPASLFKETMAVADFVDWREEVRSFERMVAYSTPDVAVTTPAGTTRARVASVSDDFWELSGAHPALGRLPNPGEAGVLLLSNKFFEQEFQADPNVIGRPTTVQGKQVIIVGVLSKTFLFQLPFPSWPGFDTTKYVDAYRPMLFSPQDGVRGRPVGPTTTVVARLRAGISPDKAQAEIQSIRARVAKMNPQWFTNQGNLVIVPLREKLTGEAGAALRVLFGAVVVVLITACANVTMLLLARSLERRKEVAIRLAMGAGQGRLMRQFLLESTMLALLGGTAGLLLARSGVSMSLWLVPNAVPRLAEITIDGTVLMFLLVVSLLTAFICGLAPAVSLRKTNLHDALKDGKTTSASPLSFRTRGLLVVGQIACAFILLCGAGLMIKSFWRMTAHPAGFDPERILIMKIQHSGPAVPDPQQRSAYVTEILRAVQSVPGVVAAGITTPDAKISLDWQGIPQPHAPVRPTSVFNVTSAGTAEVIGMRVVRGRWFTDDEPSPVIAINETLARRDFSGHDPIGKRTRLPGPSPSLWTVIGIIADVKHSRLDTDAEPEVYVPYTQRADLSQLTLTLAVRTAEDPLALAPTIRKIVSNLDTTQALFEIRTLEQALADSVAPRRVNLLLLGTFASIALLLALVGIYCIMSYSVSQRTREIGIRAALGAQRGEILWMFVRQGIAMSLMGIVIGTIGASAVTRVMKSVLYQVEPADPQTFAGVALVMFMTVIAACWRPAHRATLVDPMLALRNE